MMRCDGIHKAKVTQYLALQASAAGLQYHANGQIRLPAVKRLKRARQRFLAQL